MFCAASAAFGLENSGVLVLYNANSPEGTQIASQYAQARPGVLSLALNDVPTTEEITWDVYLNTIRPQVLAGLSDSIDCIVTTKGLPLRINNPNPGTGSWNQYSSLESELARVDSIGTRQLMGNQTYFLPDFFGGNSLALNPYAFQDAEFDYQTHQIRLTSRLDGFSVADVGAAIARAQRAVWDRPGVTWLVDDDPNAPASTADQMEDLVQQVLDPRGVDYTYDATDAFVSDAPGPVLAYVSHGVHGGAPPGYVLDEQNGLTFQTAPGAAFHTWESFNAYSFVEGGNRAGQGLVADWINRGGTVGTGHVEEPGVDVANSTNEDRLFEMLLDGYTWVEAAWNATAQLSYLNTVVGDPLMVYKTWVPGDADLDGDVDMVDITSVKAAYGTQEGQPGYSIWADMNANGVVDLWDLTFVKYHYTGPMDDPGESNPEPATLAIIVLGAASLLRRRRR